MRITRVGIIASFVLALILQPLIGALLGLDDFGPNLLLCLAAIMIVIREDSALIWACTLSACLLYDVAFSPVFGMATVGVIVSLLVIIVTKYFFYLDNIFLIPVVAAIGTLGFNIMSWLISNGIGGAYTFGYVLKYSALDFIGNIIVMMLLYLLFRKNIEKHRNDIKAF